MSIDDDLKQCLDNNPQSFTSEDIEEVIAIYEGVNDEEDWIWVIRLKNSYGNHSDSKFILLQAGCDYTGWDCRSWVSNLEYHHKPVSIEEKLQHALITWSSLLHQLNKGKAETWREKMNKEFGISSEE